MSRYDCKIKNECHFAIQINNNNLIPRQVEQINLKSIVELFQMIDNLLALCQNLNIIHIYMLFIYECEVCMYLSSYIIALAHTHISQCTHTDVHSCDSPFF